MSEDEDFYIGLYDMPGVNHANWEFKEFLEKFRDDLRFLRNRWEKYGAHDTAVSEALYGLMSDYID